MEVKNNHKLVLFSTIFKITWLFKALGQKTNILGIQVL